MTEETPPDITGAWLHSYEEDTGTAAVYRPADHPFRPSRRPRRGLEFRPDGTFVELRPGPADRPYPVAGRWRIRDGHVRVTFPEGGAAPFDLTVLSRTAGKLTIAT
ncbi:hypothetical protein Ssi03_47480 [Sphaerisporangium siamense]|uniref:Lipocalin-like domain-containing protein n=1 Tax=Sphaerisporangium siamense TaxID=795645 RepID=A0A7W7G837_9ACTN|nr:hypothetical protein [Sphaerisporangium siamense]MBB4699115.1 hypothetical protein [Sphaerisporangium siamense]GII86758.1 hypothetical protein Ssi03_47480 [Sphaerisporangium siamense]